MERYRPSALYAPLAALIAAAGMVACSSSGSEGAASGAALPSQLSRTGSSNYIQHIVVVIQENRSFDDLFATFPGADGTTVGELKDGSGDKQVPLQEVDLTERCDFGHGYHGFLGNWDHGKMDGFGLGAGKCHGQTTAAYQYVNPKQIAPYWSMADQYVLADHIFQTQGSGSWPAHQDLIAGGTMLNAKMTLSLVNNPTHTPWGCDAPPGTLTDELQAKAKRVVFLRDKGPFPCLTYSTLRDLLDAQSVSWKYYSPPVKGGEGALWNAFDAIKAVRDGPEWGVNVTNSDTQIFKDIANGQLPAVSWVVPDSENSDHPGMGKDTGPSWVASLVNAVGQSSYWDTSAVIIVWDDWGGFYDHVKPPLQDEWGGLGFRVPMLIVSPYAVVGNGSQGGYVSHTPYEFGSILKFIEGTFKLGSLGKTDSRATSILDCFDFTQSPRSFSVIPSKYSRSYFLHQAPSYKPVDTE